MLISHQSGPQAPAPRTTTEPRNGPPPQSAVQPGTVLAVGFPGPRVDRVIENLVATGHEVRHSVPGQIGPHLQQTPPDAVVALSEPREGHDVIREVRTAPGGRALPLLVLTENTAPAQVVDVLRHGADDCLPETADPFELAARIEAKRHRVPVPVENLLLDPRTGLYSRSHFLDELSKELGRPANGRMSGVVAVVEVAEMASLESRLGPRVRREVAERLAQVAEKLGSACDRFGWDEDGHLLILLPGVDEDTATRTLQQFANAAAGTRFVVADENVRLTPAIGWTPLTSAEEDPEQAVEQALDAAAEALSHRDLRPVRFVPSMRGPRHRRRSSVRGLRAVLNALSPLVVLFIGAGLPFWLYTQTYAMGFDLGSIMYWVVVAGLIVSALLIIVECLFSLDAPPRPSKPGQPYPPASAVIAAYLPNEAATIVDTVESFLALDYPNHLEVVLAYNTPHPLPVEDTLREMARRDPRLVLMEVPGSTSKAQNVNAAVTRVRGEFVGIFDADHHPAPDAFRRAWHWLSNGYDVVQGHCVIRNGDSSWVAQLVAVEFEAIYAVSHPGRTRLYDFGVFGGSNGFWRTDALARTRMHGSMLTEDIDSTMRALREGIRFTVDRALISRELAPTNLKSLWNQRSRWAQGWLQVSLKHLWKALRSPVFDRRQKLGLLVLLGWREMQPWLTLQMLPVLGYAIWKEDGPGNLDWTVPICLLAMAFTLSAGVIQAAFAWRLAIPELKKRRRWFWSYMLLTSVFYTHFKNILARQACLKEALGERQWRVTPRSATAKAGEQT
ncbi:glycosyltransferase [Streptomyces sp. NA04227]|uniref:glycosyltransferase n=1 Tax=Streptomyces sp. NA04227 TaxID=2742136 RepID=UPI001590DB75|nr:glycosyltransferase [Streptomyces sp. NA04227]QKW10030.1 glycosyltransferase [Streptomyces sp. NA04227]